MGLKQDPIELGRAVHQLRWPYGIQKRRWRWAAGKWVSEPRSPARSYGEVAKLLGTSAVKVREWEAAYYERRRPLLPKECQDMVKAYIDEHGRWPGLRQFQRNKGLPSRYHVTHNYGRANLFADVARRWKLPPQLILTLPNVTMRREMIEKYGWDYFVKGREPVQQDDWGTLWRLPGEREEVVLVEVVNATPEKDGSFAHYFLRVPPHMRTAKEAVAWSFAEEERGYGALKIRAAS